MLDATVIEALSEKRLIPDLSSSVCYYMVMLMISSSLNFKASATIKFILLTRLILRLLTSVSDEDTIMKDTRLVGVCVSAIQQRVTTVYHTFLKRLW